MRYTITDCSEKSFDKRLKEATERGHKVISYKKNTETFVDYDRVKDKRNLWNNQQFGISNKYAALMEVNHEL